MSQGALCGLLHDASGEKSIGEEWKMSMRTFSWFISQVFLIYLASCGSRLILSASSNHITGINEQDSGKYDERFPSCGGDSG